jgi:hypothetical protein
MKAAKDLGHDELVRIAEAVQDLLFLDSSHRVGDIEQYNLDKELSCADVVQVLAELASSLGLAPGFLGDEPEEPRDNCEICGSSPH